MTNRAVIIPLLNTNELEARLVAVYVNEGDYIEKGDILCTLETTKSTADVVAEQSGYVVNIRFIQGEMTQSGDTFCYLAESPDWTPSEKELEEVQSVRIQGTPEGLRITQPALSLALEYNVELERLPIGPLITAQMIHDWLVNKSESQFSKVAGEFDPRAVIIYGGGGHGKSLIDLVQSMGTYKIIGIIDDAIDPEEIILGVPVLGGPESLRDLYDEGIRMAVNAVGGIGNVNIRKKVFHILAEAGFVCPTVIHRTAFIEPSADIAPGVQIFPNTYIGSDVKVGFGNIINTGAIVSHECILDDYVNISPGAILAGGVKIGSNSLIGMGATINLQVSIGDGARIGNGATVKENVPENGIVRAGGIWPT